MKERQRRWFLKNMKSELVRLLEDHGETAMNPWNAAKMVEVVLDKLDSREYFLQKYPRICAHIIADSLGYATPCVAALILRDASHRRPNYCEWIDACYNGDALKAVQWAIGKRHTHTGYMAEYQQAKQIVDHVIEKGEPNGMLASWF